MLFKDHVRLNSGRLRLTCTASPLLMGREARNFIRQAATELKLPPPNHPGLFNFRYKIIKAPTQRRIVTDDTNGTAADTTGGAADSDGLVEVAARPRGNTRAQAKNYF